MCSDDLLTAIRDEVERLKSEAQTNVFQPSTIDGRFQAAYVRDGVVATADRMVRFFESLIKESEV
jgi:hypothetical protein